MTPRQRLVRPPPRGDRIDYPPYTLREYALLADGERGALVGPRGDVVWLCVPRWDSEAVFATLLGGPGGYAVTPQGRFVWGGYYEDDTLIWRHRWVTEDGIVECRDALCFPGDTHRVIVLRRVTAVDAEARVQLYLDPRAEYGAQPLSGLTHAGGIWSGYAGGLSWRWTGAGGARPVVAGHRLEASLVLTPGSSHDLVLEISDRPLPDAPVDPDAAWAATERGWQEAVPALGNCLAPHDSRHSYVVLRGLTAGSGGMVAAVTTSLPERAEAGRNYDYRYAWIRDQCYAGQAVAACGPHPLLDDAVRFVGDRMIEHGAGLAPAYTTAGGQVPDQHRLELPGYPGGFDVIGNRVTAQFQLDAFGEVLLLLAAAARHDRLDGEGWRAAETAVAAITARWRDPDAGIWEIDEQPWTHSRLTCAAGLRAIAAVAPARAPSARGRAEDWVGLAEQIMQDIAARATHPTGRWQRSPDDTELDGALLLPALRGAVAADDPRSIKTLNAYESELTLDGYAYRFRHDERPLGEAEGAFLLCGFLMALATGQQGRHADAIGWYERTRAACGPPVLYSEEFDVVEHQLRGNLPQAFVHALMIECSARLADA